MVLDGVDADMEPIRNCGIREALAAQTDHFQLARRQAQLLHLAVAFLGEGGDIRSDVVCHTLIILAQEFSAAGTDSVFIRRG